MTDRAATSTDRVLTGLVVLAAATCIGTLHVIFFRTPIEATMGIVQKVFYFHVPAAYGMYLGAAACFVGSALYLFRPRDRWDAVARAGAEIAVLMGLMVMITGPLWASKAWGRYWTWDPRLTTVLLSLLLYVAYLALRAFGGRGDAERRFAAALGVLGAANLPIIHLSVRKWGGQHPQVITGSGRGLQHPDMKLALGLGFATFTLLVVACLAARIRVHRAECRLAILEQQALELDLVED